MKSFLIILILSQYIFATNTVDTDKKKLLDKQIKIEMEKEKKYSKEQKFYNQKDYDFKGSEVNPDSLKNIEDIEPDDLDMDSVYD